MADYNKTLILGRLVRDPELRYTPSQQAVCDFSIATSRKFSTASGEKKEEVLYLDCTAWGKTGEAVQKYLKKGSAAFVEGHLTLQTWEAKDGGGKRSKILLTVENIQFLDGRPKDGESATPAPKAEPKPAEGEETPPW